MYLQNVEGENRQKINKDVNQQLADIQLFFDQLEQRASSNLQQKIKQLIDKARIKAQSQQQTKSTSISQYHQTFLFYQLENLLKVNELGDMVNDLQKVNYSLVSEDYLEDKSNVQVQEELVNTQNQVKKFSMFALNTTPNPQPLFEKLKLKHNQQYNYEEDQKVFTKLRDIDLYSFRQSGQQDNYFKDININIGSDIGNMNQLQQSLEDDLIIDDDVIHQGYQKPMEVTVFGEEEEDTLVQQTYNYSLARKSMADKKMKQNQELLDNNVGESIKQKKQLQQFVDLKFIKTQMIYQEGFEQSQIKSSNWVYAFNFPFNIKQKKLFMEKFMGQLSDYAGEIKQIEVYEECDLFQDFKMSKYLQELKIKNQASIGQQGMTSLYAKINHKFSKDLIEEQDKQDQEIKEQQQQKEDNAEADNNNDNDEMLQYMDQGQKTSGINNMIKSQKLMKNLQKQYSNLLNKSYVFLELKEQSSKQKILNPFLRLFGINVQGLKIQFDDADHKRTLILFNLMFNQEMIELVEYLNTIFIKKGLDLKLEQAQEDQLIQRGKIYIRLNSFQETQLAYNILNGATFRGREIKVKHYYGNNIYQAGKMREIVDEVKMYEMTRLGNGVIWGKIGQNIKRETSQIESLRKVEPFTQEEDYLEYEEVEPEDDDSQMFF